MLGLAGYLVIFFFFRKYLVLSIGPQYLLLLLISILMAAVLQFLLFEALSLLSFWIENTYGMRFTMRVIMEMTGGAIIPLSFFPVFLQKFFSFLPFPFMIYLPMAIYLGKIPAGQILVELLKEAGWITGLILKNGFIWQKGVRHYMAMGD